MISVFKKIIDNFLFGDHGGLTKDDLDVSRYKFSDLLPYIAYEDERQLYYMKDNSVGWVYECTPLIFAGNTMNNLASIFKQPLPHGSVIQTVLYADPYLEDSLKAYKDLRFNNPNLNEIYKTQIDRYCDFFRGAAKEGIWNLSHTPMRNFRLYISIKAPLTKKVFNKDGLNMAVFDKEVSFIQESVNNIVQNIDSAGLNPRPLHPADFIFVISRIFDPDTENPCKFDWNENVPIAKQMMNGGSLIVREKNHLKIGNTYARCLTPKDYPKEIDSTYMNDMIGYFGRASSSIGDDSNQIRCPFIMSSSFIVDNKLDKYIDGRFAFIGMQRAKGGAAYAVHSHKKELDWVKSVQQESEQFLRVITQLWLFDKSENSLSENINRVASMWTNLQTNPQKERSFILPKLFVSALPLGLYGDDYRDLERDQIMHTKGAAHLMTIQAGCIGLGKPYMYFIDRRAQLTSLDILYTGPNKNFLVTGGTGGGKSFLLNYIANCYLSAGAKIRIIDVGKSYKKMAGMFDGQFIEFANSGIVINFFESVTSNNDDEDFSDKISMLTGIIATMCIRTDNPISDLHIIIIEEAISECISRYGKDTNIDKIAEWLHTYKVNDNQDIEMATEARKLSKAIKPYTTKGVYGKYFNGKSNVDIKGDLTVIELDGTAEDLRRVVVLAFAAIIEDEIYCGDRKTPTIVILDEAWQTLSENPAAAKFAEGLYRKIRKYNGGVCIATQSVADLQPDGKLGQLGGVIQMQSHMHFMLPDKALHSSKKKSYVDLSDFAWHFLADKQSTALPRYSEILVKSDQFVASLRLTTDTFTYFVSSSSADDQTFLDYHKDEILKTDRDIQLIDDEKVRNTQAMIKAIYIAVETCNKYGGLSGYNHYLQTEFIPMHKEQIK